MFASGMLARWPTLGGARRRNGPTTHPRKWPLGGACHSQQPGAACLALALSAFHDHHVMIKLPVSRFTRAADQDRDNTGSIS